MIGRRLSHYEIVDELGRGGMGEVYRARDTKLKREVAIKILPEEFAQDKERLARFEREAQLLASLNHPNIASIYGIEEVDGTKALVLELVEGPTLAERIAEGPIPIDEAMAIAKQISEAFEAAHGDGVIHRDLKPANVKLTEDGQVKVLDFGLAKALQGDAVEGTDSELSQSPTLTRQGTAVGVILGTAAYMSPEQAKGKRVDRQTDIWAFGAVLYEMLTGKRAFGGEDLSDILAAVIRAEPDWTALPVRTPETIRGVLRLCLAKDRKQRLQAFGDVRLAMEGAFAASSPVTDRSWSPVAMGVAFVLGSVVAGSLLTSFGGRNDPPGPVVRFKVPLPESRGGLQWHEAAIAPDGLNLAFRVGNDLYIRPVQDIETKRVTDEELARAPFFSSDGEWLGFFDREKLKKVAVSGSARPIVLCDVPGPVSGASWEDNDTIVFAQNPGGIYRVSGNGGEAEVLIPLNEGELAQSPQSLPGGDRILFSFRHPSSTTWEEAQIVVQSLRTGERRVLVERGRFGRYAPTGHLVYFHEGTLFGVALDLSSLEIVGASVPLVENVAPWSGSEFGFSEGGALIFASNYLTTTTVPVWVSPEGREETLGLPPNLYSTLKISPDGTSVAFQLDRAGTGNDDIWIYALNEGVSRRLTFDDAVDGAPLWTPDGEHIVFLSARDGGGIFRKRSDGSGVVERLTPAAMPNAFPHSISPDGRYVLFNIQHPARSWDIKTITLGEGHVVEPVLETRFDERRASLSPNGRWIAYQSDETGEHNVFVRPFPDVDSGGKWQISTDGGTTPIWASDGSALFYSNGQTLLRVDVDTEPSFSASAPVSLIEGPYALNQRSYDVAPDGERFLMLKQASDDKLEVDVVLSWFEELKARVPTGN